MRLIDADKLIDHFEKVKKESASLVDMAYIIGFQSMIDAQPTAYDPDRVATQLENYCFEKYCAEGDSEIGRIVKGDGAGLKLECKWKLEEEGNLYVTECEKRHLAFDGTPEENGYRYCPYCGRKIKEVDD